MTENQQSDTRTFHQRLSDAGAEVAYLEKGGFNKHFKYSFLQEAEVKRAVGAALRKHGLTMHSVRYHSIGEITCQSAVLGCNVRIGDGNEYAEFSGVGAGTDSSDKAPMKACAAALKYALTSGFLIATGDDPEDDGGTKEDKSAKKSGKKETESPSADKDAKTSSDDTAASKDAPSVEERVATALTAIANITDLKGINKHRIPFSKLSTEIGKEAFEPVRQAFMARTKEVTPKKEEV